MCSLSYVELLYTIMTLSLAKCVKLILEWFGGQTVSHVQSMVGEGVIQWAVQITTKMTQDSPVKKD